MRKKRVVAAILTLAMVFSAFLGYLPSFAKKAMAAQTPVYMAHLKAGAKNGNGHFGGNSQPEAFVLEGQSVYGDGSFSFTLKLESEKNDTRFRYVTQYLSDSQWGYIAYDGLYDHWFYEFNNMGQTGYPDFTGDKLPTLNKGDVVKFSGKYISSGLQLTVVNETSGQSGTALASNESFVNLRNHGGKAGFGAGRFVDQHGKVSETDIYFSDVVIGGKAYKADDYNNWIIYNSASTEGYVWEPKVDVTPAQPDPGPQQGQGTKWITVEGGRLNGNGHSYGNPNVKAPAFLVNQDKTMPMGGTLKLQLRPTTEDMNFGIFYTYGDDGNWFYVGYDATSKWYFQYKFNNGEEYPGLGGLPMPVAGEAMDVEISLDREALQVTVDGKVAKLSAPNLFKLTEKLNGAGKFGVKVNKQTKVEFANMTVNGQNCMDDTWDWCAKRDGQVTNVKYTKVASVTGSVKDASGATIADAVVRIGAESVTTGPEGTYTFEGIEEGAYVLAVTAPGYKAFEKEITVSASTENVHDAVLQPKEEINLADYDKISSDYMDVYVGKQFPLVARYALKADPETYFRGQETDVNTIKINGVAITPADVKVTTASDAQTYEMTLADAASNINLTMTVKISVKDNDLTWQVTSLTKKDGCPKIASIDFSDVNLLTADAVEKEAAFDGAQASSNTLERADRHITWKENFQASQKVGYLYGFISNGKLSAGLWSNSEIEGDKRVTYNSGADMMGLASSLWYYEAGDKGGQVRQFNYPVSELPCVKVCVAGDMNNDQTIDWNDGAVAFRDIINIPDGAENIKDLVNYRIVMNFASMAPNPFLATADNIKKVYLATDGLPQAVMLKGYGNEGHDSANSEYADVAEREGGIKDFQELIKIAHKYNAEIGIHINAQEAYPEAKSFNNVMVGNGGHQGWGWLDQSFVIDKLWDLGTQARYKRLVQLYDRINGTSFYSGNWEKGEYVGESAGTVADKATIAADAANRPDNMDFIYLDVWYQDAWETRQIVDEINALGWRFSTEFPYEGEYDSTWSHWATDQNYGGHKIKGYNSDIIRFLRNDLRDVHVLNHPTYVDKNGQTHQGFDGTADNPLLGGFELFGFEGWGGDQNFDNYIKQTFLQNIPTKFLQHYQIIDWEVYGEGQSPVDNHEKEITLKNGNDVVVVTRNEQQRADEYIERTIKLNDKVVLNDVTYLLPWKDADTNAEKLYHYNLEGGSTTWDLLDGWNNLANVVVYELSDQGRINPQTVAVTGGKFTFDAKAATPYVVVKGEGVKTLKAPYGESDYVVDPGFNGYADGAKLDSKVWAGDIADPSVTVVRSQWGDQRLAIKNNKKDVAVSTTISGLKPGTEYVAEFYVENESDAKTEIIVNSGSKTVSEYTLESIAKNYVQCDNEHGSKMQRIQVSFTAESDKATLTVARAAGSGLAYVDDIRIVEKALKNVQADGSFVQDFETVVQGIYPFVLGSAQGVSDPVTHLSQLNAPYTQKGWNGRVIDDVIAGEWSLKHHGANTGIIYQTIPQNFRFEPGKVYNVEFEYQSGPDKAYALVSGNGTMYNVPSSTQMLPQAHTTQKASIQVVGSASGQTWIGLYEDGGKAGKGSMGQTDFVLDNLKITMDKDAVAVVIDKTELYLGETTDIVGSNIDNVEITSDNENVVTIDRTTGKINAVGAGTATITAKLPDGDKTFKVTVLDKIINDIPREEYKDITASANTAETPAGEPTFGGTAAHAVDGKNNTGWHSKWTGNGFKVSLDNPAVLTVDLGKEVRMGGFDFLQRPTGPNGVVGQYSYKLYAEDGKTVVAQGGPTVVLPELQQNAKWVTTLTENSVNARFIEISVEAGYGDFAAIAEVKPVIVKEVVAKGTIEASPMKVGETLPLEVKTAEGTVVKGLVWSTTDDQVVSVDKFGNVTGLKAGTATIKATNACGLVAEVVVTVETATEPETQAPETQAPETQAPETQTPETQAPETQAPETQAPETQTPDTEVPTKPADVKASNITSESVTLSWTASKDNVGVAGYEVFVNGESVGVLKETSAQINGLVADTEYTITIKAFDEAGNYSEEATIVVKTEKKADSDNKPSKPSKPSMKPVQTGDNFPIAAVAVVMILSGLMVGALVISKRIKKAK